MAQSKNRREVSSWRRRLGYGWETKGDKRLSLTEMGDQDKSPKKHFSIWPGKRRYLRQTRVETRIDGQSG
jgi:hypothetical protein